MANGNQDRLILWGILGILAFSVFGNGGADTSTPTVTTDGSPTIDLCGVTDPSVTFTSQRMFLAGTSITDEYVRVIRENGALKDLGLTVTNSGSLETAPNVNYRLYYGENSSTYYTEVESYTAPCQESADDKVGQLCTIDTNPTVTVFDEFGNVQTASANAQAIAADDERDLVVRVRVASDQCFGNPDADVPGTNSLCFVYSTTAFNSVEADTAAMATPFPVSSTQAAANTGIDCYELQKLQDNTYVDIPVKLKSSSTNPTTAHNISIVLDDVAFDVDADTLAPIIGFEDEDNNALGSAIVTGDTIYVS